MPFGINIVSSKDKDKQAGSSSIQNPIPSSINSLVDQVISMRQQGMSNTQIIDTLQRQGMTPDQIFDVMNQADVGPGGASPQPMPQPYPSEMYDQPNTQMQGDIVPPMEEPEIAQQYPMGTSTEDIVEAIINEKWEEVVKDIHKIVKWKHQIETRMTQIEQKLKDTQESFDKLHAAIIGKINEYDQNILNVGTEVKAMEKVFQKILPTFTENVNELSRITESIKKQSLKDKDKDKEKDKKKTE